MELKEVKKFLESEAGRSLKKFLEYQLKGLSHINWVKNLDDPVEALIEMKAQRKAYDIVQHAYDVIINIKDEKEVEEKKEEDSLIPGIE